MSLIPDAPAQAALTSRARGAHWLVEMDFAQGMQRLTTWPVDVTSAGFTYRGLGHLFEVAPVGESKDAAADKLNLSVSVVRNDLLALSMGNVESYRGRRVRLLLQLFDDAGRTAGAPLPRWSGFMNPVEIQRTRADPNGGSSSGRIVMPCTRAGMARARNYEGRRLTHAQQQADFPGDMALEGLQLLIEQPALWLSKRFQEV